MRIILSRKGFDSSSGGCPSPVVDGRPFSLPIPAKGSSPTRYADLEAGKFISDLTRKKLRASKYCHLDPDLDVSARTRAQPTDWKGSLGQESAAQSHLSNQGVGKGDLFLFFGLFRNALRCDGKWVFQGAPFHAIFGWLQVGQVLQVYGNVERILREHPWLAEHPHLHGEWPKQNAIYIGREALDIPGVELPGWGLLSTPWRLTEEGARGPATWRVPTWLDPHQQGTGMTYHPPPRWLGNGRLKAAGRGQEFVAQIEGRTDALDWASQVLST